MGYLLQILLALGAQALGEADFVIGWRVPWALLLLLPIPHLLARHARLWALRGRFARAAALLRIAQLSPPILFLWAVVVFGWVDTVRALTGSELSITGWPEPALLLSLAPFIVLQLLAIDAVARVQEGPRVAYQRARSFQVRMFLSGLAPVLLYVAVAAAVGWNDVLRVYVERVALWNAVFIALLLALLALFLPTLLKNTWETAPIAPGVQRDLLDAVARRADFRVGELLVWRTGHSMANAAIVGLLPRARVVLFSDSLLSLLSLRELAAVFAHEMGHAVRHHVAIFIAWALAFLLGADLLSMLLVEESAWLQGAFLMGAFVLWFVSFGWLSRRFELEADLFSVELLGDAEALIAALERVGGRLRDVAGWRHFSTADRVAFLRRAEREPAFAVRFRRTLRGFALSGAGLALLAVLFQLGSLFGSFREDVVYAELSLGRYAAAAERAEGTDLEPELIGLTALGQTLAQGQAGEVGAADLWSALGDALRRGKEARALALAELGALRGEREFLPLAELLADEAPRATEALRLYQGTTPEWQTQ